MLRVMCFEALNYYVPNLKDKKELMLLEGAPWDLISDVNYKGEKDDAPNDSSDEDSDEAEEADEAG